MGSQRYGLELRHARWAHRGVELYLVTWLATDLIGQPMIDSASTTNCTVWHRTDVCLNVFMSAWVMNVCRGVVSLAPGGKQNWSGLRYFDVDSMFNISTLCWFDAPIVMLSSYFVTSDYNEIWTQMYSQVTEVNHQYEYYTWWLFDF